MAAMAASSNLHDRRTSFTSADANDFLRVGAARRPLRRRDRGAAIGRPRQSATRITRRKNNDAIPAWIRRILERCLYVNLLDVVAVNDRLRCLSGGKVVEDYRHHDSRTPDAGPAVADLRIDAYSFRTLMAGTSHAASHPSSSPPARVRSAPPSQTRSASAANAVLVSHGRFGAIIENQAAIELVRGRRRPSRAWSPASGTARR